MPDKAILLKAGIAVVAGLMCLAGLYWPRIYRLSARRFYWEALGWTGVTRLGLFAMAYLVMHMPARSDIALYFTLTHKLLAGQRVYQELQTAYAPLFLYCTGAMLKVWDSPVALILQAVLVDIASMAVWLAVAEKWFSPRVVRMGAVLAICSPIAWIIVAINGQNQGWMALSVGLAMWGMTARRSGASGMGLAVSLVAVKFLGLLFVPVMFVCNRQRLRWTLGLLVPTILVYGFFWLRGGDILVPLKWVANEFEAGSVGYLLSIFGFNTLDPSSKRMVDALGILALGGAFVLTWWKIRDHRPVDVVAWTSLIVFVFLFVSKKSFPQYLLMALVPACLTLAAASKSRWRLGLLWGLFGLVGSIEGSVYHRYMIDQVGPLGWRDVMPHYASAYSSYFVNNTYLGYLAVMPEAYDFRALWHGQFPGGPTHLTVLVMLLIDVVLLSCYVWYGWTSWRYLASRVVPSDEGTDKDVAAVSVRR